MCMYTERNKLAHSRRGGCPYHACGFRKPNSYPSSLIPHQGDVYESVIIGVSIDTDEVLAVSSVAVFGKTHGESELGV